jgi:hypothetical protein
VGKEALDRINFGRNIYQPQNDNYQAYSQANSQPVAPVNVYVVSPENKPSLSARDVLVVIGEDIAKNGSTAKLIKSIIR